MISIEQAALLNAICDNPEDDTPRLIYADWLQETGTEANVARAEFIRLQIERAARGGTRTQAESTLLTRYYRDWFEEQPTYPGLTFFEVLYERGFQFRLTAKSVTSFLKSAAGLFARIPITEVQFCHITPKDAVELAKSPHLSRVRRLNQLPSDAAVDGEFSMPFDVPRDFRSPVTDDSPEMEGGNDAVLPAFAFTPYVSNLRQAALRDEWVTVVGLRPFLSNPFLIRLTELTLYSCSRVGSAVVGTITECTSAPVLQRVDLAWCRIGPEAADELPDLLRMPSLRHLGLAHNVLGDDAAEVLSMCRARNELVVTLVGNNFSDRAGEAFLNGPLLNLPTKNVDLRRNGFSQPMKERLKETFGNRVSV